jgi:hypothetical protein
MFGERRLNICVLKANSELPHMEIFIFNLWNFLSEMELFVEPEK